MRLSPGLLLGFLVIYHSNCFGQSSLTESERKLGQVQSKIQKKSKQLEKLKAEKDALVAQLRNQELLIGRLSKAVKKTENNIAEKRTLLSKLSEDLLQAQHVFDGHQDVLKKQLQAAYAMGEKELLKLIFSQQSSVVSSRMMRYYDYLNKARLAKLDQAKAAYLELKRLEALKLEEEVELNETLALQRQEQKQLRNVANKRELLLARLDKKFFNARQQLDQLHKNEVRLQQLIAKVQRSEVSPAYNESIGKSFSRLKGKLPWPLQGTIVNKFGSRRLESRWDGVVIKAKAGAPIHAVNRGEVVYADWLRGYGLLTIINHGNNFLTLYAFSESLYKQEGDRVEAGDVIASVGNSGGRATSALYFGIRKKSKAVNPLRWCKKINGNQVR